MEGALAALAGERTAEAEARVLELQELRAWCVASEQQAQEAKGQLEAVEAAAADKLEAARGDVEGTTTALREALKEAEAAAVLSHNEYVAQHQVVRASLRELSTASAPYAASPAACAI